MAAAGRRVLKDPRSDGDRVGKYGINFISLEGAHEVVFRHVDLLYGLNKMY